MKRIFWTLVVIIVVVLVCLAVSGKGAKQSLNEPIKIGAALALSGDAAPWGEVSKNAAKIALDEINSAGGIRGRKVELVVEDTKSSSKDSVLAVSKLVNVDKVAAVMITWLDSYPGAESVIPKNMLLISQDAAIESVNVPITHPNVFSMWYRTAAKASVTIGEMVRSGVKKLYIVSQNDPYYKKLVEFLRAEATRQGATIVAEESLTAKDDTRTTVAKIGSAKPDAVFFGSYDDQLSVSFIKRYREILKSNVPLYGDEFIEQDFTNKNYTPSWFEGVKYYVPADPNPNFTNKYTKQFNQPPKFSAGTTYDTVKIIAKYLTDNPTDVVNYMHSTQFDTTTYGKITFDAIGGIVSPVPSIAMKQIINQKIVPVK